MIKRIFIILFLFIFSLNIVGASFTIPYTNNTEIKYDKVIGHFIYDTGDSFGDIFGKTIDNEYIVYRKGNQGTYRLNLNSLIEEKISFGNTEKVLFSSNGDYMYYYDRHGGGFVKQNTSDLTKTVITGNVNSYSYDISSDNQYIIYSHGGNSKIYKKNVNEIGGNGIEITNQPSSAIKIIGNDIFYNNQSQVIFKKSITNEDSNDNGTIFISGGVTNQMTTDGEFLYYTNGDDLGRIYRKKLDGTEESQNFSMELRSNNIYYEMTTNNIIYGGSPNVVYKQSINNHGAGGTQILSSYINSYISVENGYIYYLIEGKVYKINVSSPSGFYLNKYYSSPIISNNDGIIYIKTNTSIEEGMTNYDFYIGNTINEFGELPESSDNVIGWETFMFNGGITPNINIGDTVILFKGDEKTEPLNVVKIGGNFLEFDKSSGFGYSEGWGLKRVTQNFIKLNNSVLDGTTEINTQTIFGSVSDKLFYKIVLLSNDVTKTPVINSVNITATPQVVVTPPDNNGGNTPSASTGGINLNLGDGTSISIPVEKQTTDFIKSLAKQSSITPASFNTIKNVETFLKENNYDYKNQILIGSGDVPDKTMYNVVNLGFTNSTFENSLSGAINSPDYSKLILNQNTYLAGKRIINYLKMDKADEDGNLIISIYNSDTKEYIFLKPKN